jgi:hypothetical protein
MVQDLTRLRRLTSLSQIPWAVRFMGDFFEQGGSLRSVAETMVTKRMELGSTARDLFYHLVRPRLIVDYAIFDFLFRIRKEKILRPLERLTRRF